MSDDNDETQPGLIDVDAVRMGPHAMEILQGEEAEKFMHAMRSALAHARTSIRIHDQPSYALMSLASFAVRAVAEELDEHWEDVLDRVHGHLEFYDHLLEQPEDVEAPESGDGRPAGVDPDT